MKKPSVSNVPADFLPKTLDAISRCTIERVEQHLPRILKTKLLANVAVRVLTHWTYYKYSGSDFTTCEAKLGCTILNSPTLNCRIYSNVFNKECSESVLIFSPNPWKENAYGCFQNAKMFLFSHTHLTKKIYNDQQNVKKSQICC